MLVLIKNRYINVYNISYIEERKTMTTDRYHDIETFYLIHMNNGENIKIDDRDYSRLVGVMHIR